MMRSSRWLDRAPRPARLRTIDDPCAAGAAPFGKPTPANRGRVGHLARGLQLAAAAALLLWNAAAAEAYELWEPPPSEEEAQTTEQTKPSASDSSEVRVYRGSDERPLPAEDLHVWRGYDSGLDETEDEEPPVYYGDPKRQREQDQGPVLVPVLVPWGYYGGAVVLTTPVPPPQVPGVEPVPPEAERPPPGLIGTIPGPEFVRPGAVYVYPAPAGVTGLGALSTVPGGTASTPGSMDLVPGQGIVRPGAIHVYPSPGRIPGGGQGSLSTTPGGTRSVPGAGGFAPGPASPLPPSSSGTGVNTPGGVR